MKYRRLTLEELNTLETEFVQFLASQSIPAPDWEKMKSAQPAQAEKMIELFSDIVLDKVLEKIDLLELRQKNKLVLLKCNQDGIEMRGMQVEGTTDFDLRQPVTQEKMEAFLSLPSSKIQLLSAQKKYTAPRSEEIFKLLSQGYLISKNQLLYQNLAR